MYNTQFDTCLVPVIRTQIPQQTLFGPLVTGWVYDKKPHRNENT